MIATSRALLGLICGAALALSIAISLRAACPKPHTSLGVAAAEWRWGTLRAVLFAKQPMPDLAGTYEGRAPPGDEAGRLFTLNLSPDGTAIWKTLYLGKNSTAQFGHWHQNGSELVLTFDALGANPPPSPITFRYHHQVLQPIHWDQSEWGRIGPPVLRRTRAGRRLVDS